VLKVLRAEISVIANAMTTIPDRRGHRPVESHASKLTTMFEIMTASSSNEGRRYEVANEVRT